MHFHTSCLTNGKQMYDSYATLHATRDMLLCNFFANFFTFQIWT